MRRVIFGAGALVAATLAAVGIAGRRRRVRGDEWLPVEPAPPIGATTPGRGVPALAGDTVAAEPSGSAESAASAEPSVEADYGPVGGSAPVGGGAADAPAKPRARARRKASSEPEGPDASAPGDARLTS